MDEAMNSPTFYFIFSKLLSISRYISMEIPLNYLVDSLLVSLVAKLVLNNKILFISSHVYL